MKLFWKAHYYDGKTAERHEVELTVSPESLSVKGEGFAATWPLSETGQTQGFNKGEPVRLERGREAIVVDDPEFIRCLCEVAPGHRKRFAGPERTRKTLFIIPAALALTALIVAGVYFWAIPKSTAYAAQKVPPSVEDRLGQSMIKGITDAVPQCESPELAEAAETILKRLEAAAPGHPYEFRVYALESPAVNALAAPGGHIVLFSGLIESMETPEELAGVMAHEMQHILLKHSTQSMLRELSTGLLLAAAFGDFNGISSAAGTLGSLSYSREFEDEADRLGADLLVESGTDPQGLITFFERLWECECKKKKSRAETLLSYLSTHPSTLARIESLKAHLETRPATEKFEPLLPETDWEKVKSSCSQIETEKEHSEQGKAG